MRRVEVSPIAWLGDLPSSCENTGNKKARDDGEVQQPQKEKRVIGDTE